MKNFRLILLLVPALLSATGCSSSEKKKQSEKSLSVDLSFQARLIYGHAKHWWAHCPADVTGDGITDLVFIHNNSTGGYLAYLKGSTDTTQWKEVKIAEAAPGGGLFASGDMECGDMDGDGDVDVLGVKHPGEWQDAGAEAEIYWYENPGWEAHLVGSIPDALKDVSLADFNSDGLLDLSVMTFDENTLSVFLHTPDQPWNKVLYLEHFDNLHEGMGVGDFDGDGDTDILATGHLFYNPGGDLSAAWETENLDEKWNNQRGDWSRNGTKTFVRDIDKNGTSEIFISHSERAGYPLSMYKRTESDQWEEQIILDSIPACHTLQIYDFDLDASYDILAGVNMGRAVNLGFDTYEVLLLLSRDNYRRYTRKLLSNEGIYNGQVADYDGDGDMDIFRYPNHEATEFYLLENKIID